ncbi:MAG: hypothetical protein CEN90_79 [Parcubacteria group bacterium Licking1014_17]|nr:MAG: hypothetical protein CEN90_79 [Parcubacteria group bacterium Licking1014_17]
MKYTVLFLFVLLFAAGITLGFLGRNVVFVKNSAGGNFPIAIKTPEPEKTLLILGDIMLGRHVEVLMDKNGEDYPFEKISGLLKGADLVFANLEGPIVNDHQRTPELSTFFSFKSSIATLLKKYNIGVVSLANNHLLDQGKIGLQDAKDLLALASVAYTGDPTTIDADNIFYTKLGNANLALIGFNATWPSFDKVKAFNLIKSVKTASPDKFVIVYLHWGEEYQVKSNAAQKALSHEMIDAGADLIVGSHPHVVQDEETYKDKRVFYSLGNFIFDQYFSKEVQTGRAIRVKFSGGSVSYETIPYVSKLSQPQPVL